MAQPVRQKTVPTVYNMSSSQALVVMFALEEVSASHGIKYHVKNVPRRGRDTSKQLKSIFPLGKSPIVTLESVDGEPPQIYQILPNVLTESRLILQFISDNYSTGEWVPESEQEKRRDAFFQELAKSSFSPKIFYAVTFEAVPLALPFGFRQLASLLVKPIVGHFKGDQRDFLQLMEDALSDEVPWFSGKKMGLADFNMSFAMDIAAQRGYFDSKSYPKLAKWHSSILERPAYKRALEKAGVYDLVNWA